MDNTTTNPSSSATSKADRKTIERNRRNQMKLLYSQLNSLIPRNNNQVQSFSGSSGSSNSSRDGQPTPLPDQLEEATNYIIELQGKVTILRKKREQLLGANRSSSRIIGSKRSSITNNTSNIGFKSPKIEVQEKDSALEVVLITGLECQFVFNEAIRILYEEGTEIVNAAFNVVEDTVFHTIHAQTGEVAPSYKAARITQRLNKFVIDD